MTAPIESSCILTAGSLFPSLNLIARHIISITAKHVYIFQDNKNPQNSGHISAHFCS